MKITLPCFNIHTGCGIFERQCAELIVGDWLLYRPVAVVIVNPTQCWSSEQEDLGYLLEFASFCRVTCKRIEKGKEVTRNLRFYLLKYGVELRSRHEG